MSTNYKLSPTQREIVSGLTAGFVTTSVTHPLDLLKIRLQLDASNTTVVSSTRRIISSLRKESPIKTLKEVYRGVIPNLVGSSVAWGVYFASYRYVKDAFHFLAQPTIDPLVADFSPKTNKDSTLRAYHYLSSAFIAGSFTALVTNPIWVLKTRILSTSSSTPGAYTGLIDGYKRVLEEEGIFGFWKGFVPSLLGVSQGALQFTVYDSLKYHWLKSDERQLKVWEYIAVSCVSKIVAAVTLYPCQVLKSRLQDYQSIKQRKRVRDVVWSLYHREGIRGFYKGVAPNVIRVLPATCITFTVYESLSKVI